MQWLDGGNPASTGPEPFMRLRGLQDFFLPIILPGGECSDLVLLTVVWFGSTSRVLLSKGFCERGVSRVEWGGCRLTQ